MQSVKGVNVFLLKPVLTDWDIMFIIYIILQKAMKEKQVTGLFRELPVGARQ